MKFVISFSQMKLNLDLRFSENVFHINLHLCLVFFL